MERPTPDPTDLPLALSLTRPVGRRGFLTAAGLGAGALAATAVLRPGALVPAAGAATPGPGNILVYVFLRGAADGLSFLSPLGDATLAGARPGVAIPDHAALALDGRFGLHPSMTRIAALHAAGRAAFVPAAGSPNPDRSHFAAQAMMERGSATDASLTTGWLGRYLQATTRSGDDRLRGFGVATGTPLALRGSPAVAAPRLESLSLAGVGGGVTSAQVQTALAQMYPGSAHEAVRTAADDALGIVRELAPIVATSAPPTGWTTGFLPAFWPVAKLVADGFPVEIATIDLGGWDEHDAMGSPTDPNANQTRLVAGLDAAVGAFFDQLGAAAARTTVIVTTEFGRRIALNGSGGTDHGRGMVMMLLGAGVQPGVRGAWPGLVDTDAGDVRVVNDARTVCAEVLARRMRPADLTTVFPGFDVRPPTWLGVATA